jgi:signal transduction histidine kinase
MVLVFRDVTERHRAQQEHLKIDKLESVGVLAGGIAHDFNNLLTAILNNVAVAQLRGSKGVGAEEALERAENATLRARHLTQQLLTFSKGGAPVREVLALPSLVEEATRFSLSGSGVDCEFLFPEELWPVEADEGQLTQVISNLVVNADHAVRGSGTIRVECSNVTVRPEDGLPLDEGRYVSLAVADNGMGIPREYLPKIFDPYFTTKKKGSGLGLSASYSIVKRHGGHITVDTRLNKGSSFHLFLPVYEGNGHPQEPEELVAYLREVVPFS